MIYLTMLKNFSVNEIVHKGSNRVPLATLSKTLPFELYLWLFFVVKPFITFFFLSKLFAFALPL